ncbi:Rv0361 family membrane protein [Planosporangium mesophilum]|uniref:DUF4878 domain-containing protein n=1 Tax=Planosporangium mesophilum TaxID=689768 RepID=A0A8J3X1M3_9ACTN|nr:hypothetical protein [Planosporangium mesophilum]NJC85529.1 hypothetical protein [Planosporangium mesophilum]GII24605.1 hypothetical protein Pme01_42020 [Planosporangium mesophilum]
MSTPGGYPDEPFAAAPPPGPGVTPPFTAPPVDRNRGGLWIGLGVGALVLVLCCVGGLAGFGLLTVGGIRQLETQATEEVSGYLDALEAGDYDAAYSHLCSDLKRNLTSTEFAARQRDEPQIMSYRIQQPQVGNTVIVPAEVRYEDGTSALRRYEVRQEPGGQELRVCGNI